MNDQQMRELLQEIIDDVDQGRVVWRRPRAFKTASTVLAAAAALGLAACSGPAKRDVQDPGDNRPATTQVDAGATSTPTDAQAQPDPMARPPHNTDPMRPPSPVPAYGVPATPPSRMDPGATPDYGVP